ncbi:MAG TPA: SAM-dependent DNA methyltransferase, partial [Candidatus Latescibacteria bacterium]|nr:SAM-dependent DNA methyltransferase [Candidatus Latescibacterota bacterium]
MPLEEVDFHALWAYCTSDEFEENLRMLDKKMSVTAGTFTKVPFDYSKWKNKYSLEADAPYTNDPTQWIFHGYPSQSDTPLQVAVARLLGYQWPAELDEEMELSNEARSLVERSKTLNSYAD